MCTRTLADTCTDTCTYEPRYKAMSILIGEIKPLGERCLAPMSFYTEMWIGFLLPFLLGFAQLLMCALAWSTRYRRSKPPQATSQDIQVRTPRWTLWTLCIIKHDIIIRKSNFAHKHYIIEHFANKTRQHIKHDRIYILHKSTT